jgi:hypothetical protein
MIQQIHSFLPYIRIFDHSNLDILHGSLQGQDHNQQVEAEDPMEEQEKLKMMWQNDNICPSFSFKESFVNAEMIMPLLNRMLKHIWD